MSADNRAALSESKQLEKSIYKGTDFLAAKDIKLHLLGAVEWGMSSRVKPP